MKINKDKLKQIIKEELEGELGGNSRYDILDSLLFIVEDMLSKTPALQKYSDAVYREFSENRPDELKWLGGPIDEIEYGLEKLVRYLKYIKEYYKAHDEF